jgi:hypothetical protein
VSGLNLKALDDLYIDDEGDDDIQLADEASGLGPLKTGKKNIDESTLLFQTFPGQRRCDSFFFFFEIEFDGLLFQPSGWKTKKKKRRRRKKRKKWMNMTTTLRR